MVNAIFQRSSLSKKNAVNQPRKYGSHHLVYYLSDSCRRLGGRENQDRNGHKTSRTVGWGTSVGFLVRNA